MITRSRSLGHIPLTACHRINTAKTGDLSPRINTLVNTTSVDSTEAGCPSPTGEGGSTPASTLQIQVLIFEPCSRPPDAASQRLFRVAHELAPKRKAVEPR